MRTHDQRHQNNNDDEDEIRPNTASIADFICFFLCGCGGGAVLDSLVPLNLPDGPDKLKEKTAKEVTCSYKTENLQNICTKHIREGFQKLK